MKRYIVAAFGLLAVVPCAQAQAPASVSAAEINQTPGEQRILTVFAKGVQIYECKPGTDGRPVWTFKEPRADLSVDGKGIGKHYAGPTWEHADGSSIKGRVGARADASSASDIPWLRLAGIEGKGSGVLASVSTILRINTKGGVKAGGCDAVGSVHEEPYTSDYVFLRKG